MASVNHIGLRPFSAVKRAVLKPGPQIRQVEFGLLKGLNLQIDFKSQTQMYFGLYETETFAFSRQATGRADWLVDIGAGAGELALYFMKNHGPHTVCAFEPLQVQRGVFADNLAANGWKLSDISLSDKFVGTDATAGCLALDATRSLRISRARHSRGRRWISMTTTMGSWHAMGSDSRCGFSLNGISLIVSFNC